MNASKGGTITILLGLAAISAQPASAAMYKTSCYKQDCVRFECDDKGTLCFRLGFFQRDTYDLANPSCNEQTLGAPSGGIGQGPTGCGSGPSPQYHYLNHFDPHNDYPEYPGLGW